MRAKWLEHLIDPYSKQALVLEEPMASGEHVMSGRLRTSDGSAVYPIIGGIPRLCSESFYRATSHAESSVTKTVQCYGNFWKRIDHSRDRADPIHTADEVGEFEQVLHAMLGVTGGDEFASLFKDGMNCLNAGCGVTWSEYVFNVNENVNRFAVDLSMSVEVAFDRTRELANVFVAQADLYHLPFPDFHFDIIFSGGVLHHTPSPASAFAALCRHLKPGGLIGIFVYKVKPLLRELADREIKKFTTEMRLHECEAFATQMASLGQSLQRITEDLIVCDDIPLLGIKRGRYSVQKFIFDHFLKCYYNAKLGSEHSVMANLDWYAPKQASHHTREEVTSWFEQNEIREPCYIEPPGWEHASFFVSGRKSL